MPLRSCLGRSEFLAGNHGQPGSGMVPNMGAILLKWR